MYILSNAFPKTEHCKPHYVISLEFHPSRFYSSLLSLKWLKILFLLYCPSTMELFPSRKARTSEQHMSPFLLSPYVRIYYYYNYYYYYYCYTKIGAAYRRV